MNNPPSKTIDRPPPFTAVILCGGRSSRMGQDKAFIEIDGQPLIERQINLARQCGASKLLVSGHRNADYASFTENTLYDKTPGCGPISGLIAGLSATQTPLILLLAVDMPNIAPELIANLHSHCTLSQGAVYHHTDCYEPLCTFYPVSMLIPAKRQFAQEDYSLQPLIRYGVENGLLHKRHLAMPQANRLRSWNHRQDSCSSEKRMRKV